MKKLILFKSSTFILIIGMCFLFSGCEKEKLTQVKIKLDYLENGGFYNDDIDAVPFGLNIGENGPYPADPEKTYTIEYKASQNFPTIVKTWQPTSGPWTIHCYVAGNTAYLITKPGH